jgi:prostaglandin-E synthase
LFIIKKDPRNGHASTVLLYIFL